MEHLGVDPNPLHPIDQYTLLAANKILQRTKRYAEALENLRHYVDDKFQEPVLRGSPLKDVYHEQVQEHLARLQPKSLLTEAKRDITMLERELLNHGFPITTSDPQELVLTPYEYETSEDGTSSSDVDDLASFDGAFDNLRETMGSDHVQIDHQNPNPRVTIPSAILSPPTNGSSHLNYRTVSQPSPLTVHRDSALGSLSRQPSLADELQDERHQHRLSQIRLRALEDTFIARRQADEEAEELGRQQLSQYREMRAARERRLEEMRSQPSPPQAPAPAPRRPHTVHSGAEPTTPDLVPAPALTGYPTPEQLLPQAMLQAMTEMGRLISQLQRDQTQARREQTSFMNECREHLRPPAEGSIGQSAYSPDDEGEEQSQRGSSPPVQPIPDSRSPSGVINFETNAKNLPKFDGTGNFRAFRNGFDTVVLDDPRLPSVTKCNLLRNHLVGNAQQCISHDDDPLVAYQTTMDMLESVYGKGDTQRGLLERFRKLKFHQSNPEQMKLDLTSHQLLVQRLVSTGLSATDDRITMGLIGKLPISFRDKVTEFYTDMDDHPSAIAFYQRIRKHINSFENGLIAASLQPLHVAPVNEIPSHYVKGSVHVVDQKQQPKKGELRHPTSSSGGQKERDTSAFYIDPATGAQLGGHLRPGKRGVHLTLIARTFPLPDETSKKPCAACGGSHSPTRCHLTSQAFREATAQKGLCANCCGKHAIEQCKSHFT